MKQENKHTPAPWGFEKQTGFVGFTILGKNRKIIANRWFKESDLEDFDDQEDRANAHLIAASPQLLEVAELTRDYFSVMRDILENSCENHRAEIVETRTVKNRTLDDIFDEIDVKLPKVIKKARGEQ